MWKVIGASVTGAAHEAVGKGCEDASGWRAELNVTCLAVADGAGSRPMSRDGAALAIERALLIATACAQRGDADNPTAWLQLTFKDVREQITAMAATAKRAAGDYAATLAVPILTGDLICIGQVGDTIAVIGYQGRYETAAPAPASEYV